MKNSKSQPEDLEKTGQSTPSQIDLLLKARGSDYGDVRANFKCLGFLKAAFMMGCQAQKPWMKEPQVHNELIGMALLKLARIATATRYIPDNYDDLQGYVRLAQREAEKMHEELENEPTETAPT